MGENRHKVLCGRKVSGISKLEDTFLDYSFFKLHQFEKKNPPKFKIYLNCLTFRATTVKS